jgi:hypothetical protein
MDKSPYFKANTSTNKTARSVSNVEPAPPLTKQPTTAPTKSRHLHQQNSPYFEAKPPKLAVMLNPTPPLTKRPSTDSTDEQADVSITTKHDEAADFL